MRNRDNRVEAFDVVLIGARFECTRCGDVKPATEFGLRKTADGKVRNQAQCTECRADCAARQEERVG